MDANHGGRFRIPFPQVAVKVDPFSCHDGQPLFVGTLLTLQDLHSTHSRQLSGRAFTIETLVGEAVNLKRGFFTGHHWMSDLSGGKFNPHGFARGKVPADSRQEESSVAGKVRRSTIAVIEARKAEDLSGQEVKPGGELSFITIIANDEQLVFRQP